jgi:quercetin dioxygenase-like cupin family protein
MSAAKTPAGGTVSETVILGAFAAEGLRPSRWSNAPGDVYAPHEHAYHKVLYCLRGSIVFRLADGEIELRPGDRLDIEPGTRHGAVVGDEGVECVEAPRGGGR